MPIEIHTEEADFVVIRLSGFYTESDAKRAEEVMKEVIQTKGTTKALILLSGFKGWQESEAWGDVTFAESYGDKIEKMAFVGAPRWRDDIYMFTGKSIRKTEIEYFEASKEADARAWLK